MTQLEQQTAAAPVRDVRHAKTSFGDIAYSEQGTGPAALFVHGVFLNGYLWRHVAEHLSDVRRCITVDLLAHGDTRTASGCDLTFSSQADMLAEFCEALHLDQVDLVGNDSGGGIAQIFATRYPDKLRSMTLTNCDVHDNCPPQAIEPLLNVLRQGQMTGFGKAMLANADVARRALGAGYEFPERLSPETIQTYLQPLFGTEERAQLLERLLQTCFLAPECHSAFVLQGLSTVRTPTLVVWGTADIFFDVKWAEWLRNTIPGTREVVMLEGAKLFFPEERPHELVHALLRFWDGLH
jgi:pimeloyl-ACP methyl ester carboxylesterase